MKNIFVGLLFFSVWFLVGRAVGRWTYDQFVMASIGGVYTPPAIWSLARDLGVTVLPVLLVFGGVPAAVQIARGRPWKKIAIVAFALCSVSWLVLHVIVLWGFYIWGWSW